MLMPPAAPVITAQKAPLPRSWREGLYFGVRCSVIHPGFTDTPMVRALGEEFIRTKVLPQTQLKRLIRPEEIADAICFMVTNAAVSGELWADAGWRPAT
jgi:3-oxoacyl-[acyl-carrier protein] reductase